MKKFSIFILAFFLIWFYFYTNIIPDPPKIPAQLYIRGSSWTGNVYVLNLNNIQRHSTGSFDYIIYPTVTENYSGLTLLNWLNHWVYSINLNQRYSLKKEWKVISYLELWYTPEYTWLGDNYLIYGWTRYWETPGMGSAPKTWFSELYIFDLVNEVIFRVKIIWPQKYYKKNNLLKWFEITEILGYKNL